MGDTMLELALRDVQGQPVPGADVRFDLTMLGMGMPPNRPQATDAGEGLYWAQTIFTMAGEWQIRVQVSHQHATEEFAFHLRKDWQRRSRQVQGA
jgi:hypothetical protein